MKRVSMAVFAVAACTGLVYAGGGPTYVKWEEAKKIAAQTGKPIAVYSTVNQDGGGC
jgi:hypothetical protein